MAFLVLHLILRLCFSLTLTGWLAREVGLPSALTIDALVWAFFFNLDSGTQVPIHVHVTNQPISATRL